MMQPEGLEPYTVRLEANLPQGADPVSLTRLLLEDIARLCQTAGASLIGHLKCHGRVGDVRFHCNLTSVHSGARCSAERVAGAAGPLEVDLAVLVFGLAWPAVDALVREALAGSQRAWGGSWSLHHPAHSHPDTAEGSPPTFPGDHSGPNIT
jgi:hypothetical protein